MAEAFIYLLGAECIAFAILVFIVLQLGKNLVDHLGRFHRNFVEENLLAPYWAGDREVMRQHFRAVSNTYFLRMPDNTSTVLQRKLRIFAILALTILAIFVVTLGGGFFFFVSFSKHPNS
jgi:hypothetical protein